MDPYRVESSPSTSQKLPSLPPIGRKNSRADVYETSVEVRQEQGRSSPFDNDRAEGGPFHSPKAHTNYKGR